MDIYCPALVFIYYYYNFFFLFSDDRVSAGAGAKSAMVFWRRGGLEEDRPRQEAEAEGKRREKEGKQSTAKNSHDPL